VAICQAAGRVGLELARPFCDNLRPDLGGRMADYTATAIAEGNHWVIDVTGVGST
jgi:hypothetical protein